MNKKVDFHLIRLVHDGRPSPFYSFGMSSTRVHFFFRVNLSVKDQKTILLTVFVRRSIMADIQRVKPIKTLEIYCTRLQFLIIQMTDDSGPFPFVRCTI